MKMWVRFTFICLAYSLALLHTAVPHHHGRIKNSRLIITAPGCQAADSTGGFLQTVFATDLGYGHLETFNKSSDPKTNICSPAVHLPVVFAPVTCLHLSVCEFQDLWAGHIEKLHKQLLLFSSFPLRAPPVG